MCIALGDWRLKQQCPNGSVICLANIYPLTILLNQDGTGLLEETCLGNRNHEVFPFRQLGLLSRVGRDTTYSRVLRWYMPFGDHLMHRASDFTTPSLPVYGCQNKVLSSAFVKGVLTIQPGSIVILLRKDFASRASTKISFVRPVPPRRTRYQKSYKSLFVSFKRVSLLGVHTYVVFCLFLLPPLTTVCLHQLFFQVGDDWKQKLGQEISYSKNSSLPIWVIDKLIQR